MEGYGYRGDGAVNMTGDSVGNALMSALDRAMCCDREAQELKAESERMKQQANKAECAAINAWNEFFKMLHSQKGVIERSDIFPKRNESCEG